MTADKRRVLFVHSATRPPLGADTWVHALIMRSLDPSSHEVHVACAPGTPANPTPTFEVVSRIPGVRIVPVNLGPEMFARSRLGKVRAAVETVPALASLVALARYVRRHRIDILHTSDRPRDALACVLLARLTGARSIVHVHVAYGDWMSPILKASMARADGLIGVSDFVARTLVAAGYSPEKTHSVLNAVDVDEWDPSLDGTAVRRELGIPNTTPLIVTVARIFPAKGHVELVRALAIVCRDFPSATLLVVGQDYPPGTHFSADLSVLARELGVADNIRFLGQRRDIARLLAAADVFALPSFAEPFGLAFTEAMAMKRPVVALDNGGAPEVVEHGRSGLLSPPGDVDTLAAHLSTLIRDPALRAKMGEYGRKQVETKFNPERLARDVANVYAHCEKSVR